MPHTGPQLAGQSSPYELGSLLEREHSAVSAIDGEIGLCNLLNDRASLAELAASVGAERAVHFNEPPWQAIWGGRACGDEEDNVRDDDAHDNDDDDDDDDAVDVDDVDVDDVDVDVVDNRDDDDNDDDGGGGGGGGGGGSGGDDDDGDDDVDDVDGDDVDENGDGDSDRDQ